MYHAPVALNLRVGVLIGNSCLKMDSLASPSFTGGERAGPPVFSNRMHLADL